MKESIQALQTAVVLLTDEDHQNRPQIVHAIKTSLTYLNELQKVEFALLKLHRVATESLINDPLDESAKGHRLGTIEVCEALLKIFG